jgi:hypothetical protein
MWRSGDPTGSMECSVRQGYLISTTFKWLFLPRFWGDSLKHRSGRGNTLRAIKQNENRHSIVRSPSPLNIRDTETITPAKIESNGQGCCFRASLTRQITSSKFGPSIVLVSFVRKQHLTAFERFGFIFHSIHTLAFRSTFESTSLH